MLVAAVLLPGLAHAEGYSVDIELLRAGFGQDAVPGVDSAVVGAARTWRVGLLGQYEEDPLILYDLGNEIGPVVRQRRAAQLAVNYAITEAAGVRLMLPMAHQMNSWVPPYAADGFGMGDLGAAFRYRAVDLSWLAAGARIDFTFPTGKKDAYMGERGLRTGGALLAMVHTERLAWLVDAGAVARPVVETEADFELGTELVANTAVRVTAWPGRVWAYTGVLGRAGANYLFQGGAENSAELLAGIEGQPHKAVQVGLGWGRGLNDGYGTTEQRWFGTVTWIARWEPRPDAPEPTLIITEVPVEAPTVDVDQLVEEEEAWVEGELARVKGEEIVIRDPIQFEFNTERILPESIPTLRAVAGLLKVNDRIAHLVVEGHASEEGTFAYNYDLSLRRARAVWEQLVIAGVHPDRVSFRGMGEVDPRLGEAPPPPKLVTDPSDPRFGEVDETVPEDVGTTADEATLAANRRVEFHIVHQLDPLELAPKHGSRIRLPWSGQGAEVAEPPPGQTETVAAPPRKVIPAGEELPLDLDLFKEDDDGAEKPARPAQDDDEDLDRDPLDAKPATPEPSRVVMPPAQDADDTDDEEAE